MWFYIFVSIIMYKTVKILLEKLSISNLSERYVLITGCDTGFGNLLAKKLDHLGLRVFACCLTKDGVEELHNQCSSKLVAIEMDVRKEESIRNCLRIVRQRLGDQGIQQLCFLLFICTYISYKYSVKKSS